MLKILCFTITIVAVLLLQNAVQAFVSSRTKPYLSRSTRGHDHFARSTRVVHDLKSTKDPLEDFSEERKAELFQFLLRDLEVEGVPLLGCDAGDPTTFLAALFTTMAELSAKDKADKACLVLEKIPMDAIRTLVDDFLVLKTQDRLMDALPELQRFTLSLVGKGVGPAVVIETQDRTMEEIQKYAELRRTSPDLNEEKWTSAMKSFTSRMIEGQEVTTSPFLYRPVGAFDACDILSAYWYCMCELISLPDDQAGASVLAMPPVSPDIDCATQMVRFGAISELLSRTLFLFRGEDLFELLHMHPNYDRNSVFPEDKPAHGHLPPTGWLRAMMIANGNQVEADQLSADDLGELQNYQRRSPLPATIITRVSQLDAAISPENAVIQLDLGGGRKEMASGLRTYSRIALDLSKVGKEQLQASLDEDMLLTK